MADGWLLSEGEVVASAAELDAGIARSRLCRLARRRSKVLVAPAPLLILSDPGAELALLDAEGRILRLHLQQRWLLPPLRSARRAATAVAAPKGILSGAGLAPGWQVEFRSAA